jgi:hypothetical protein
MIKLRFHVSHRVALLLLLFVASLSNPIKATAATYAVDACQHPDGAIASTTGWTPAYNGSNMYYGSTCASGGTLATAVEPTMEHAFGDYATWSFAAPAGTTIRRLVANSSGQVGSDRPYGSPEAFVRTATDYMLRCAVPYGCASVAGVIDTAVADASYVEFGVSCGGAPNGRCPAGATTMALNRIQMTLNDDASPIFSGSPTGSLMSATSIARIRTVNYSATDVGSGLYSQRLLADGREIVAGEVDANGGKCVRYPAGNGFPAPVPCRTSATGSMTYDTAGLSDGQHELQLDVYDATASNKASTAWTVVVDNAPPVLGEVDVDGVARDGDVLRCAAPVAGQTPSVTFQWQRAAADGSDVRDIVGAAEVTYSLTANDVGKKILCKVSAADGGGAATRTSTLTSGPFAQGGLVTQKNSAKQTDITASAQGPAGAYGHDGAPGNTGASGLAGAAGGGAAGAPGGVLPPLQVCARANVAVAGTVTKTTRSFLRSGMRLSGRMVVAGGTTGIGGATLDVMQTVTRVGISKRAKVSSTKTKPDGSFNVAVPAGPSRVLQLVDPGCGAVGVTITERVRGRVQAKSTTPRVRNKKTARFSGRVLGGYIGRGLPLELQVKVGSTWKDVKAVTTNARGSYRASYRFLRTFVRYTYRFRVVSRAGSGWPFMAARSSEVKVRVN